MSTIQPLADYLVAEAEEAPTKTAAGLFIPGGVGERPKTAVVIAVGPGRSEAGKAMPMAVKPGDRILYSYSTTEIKSDGRAYLIIKEDSVLAVIKD